MCMCSSHSQTISVCVCHFQYNTQDTESDSHTDKFRVWDWDIPLELFCRGWWPLLCVPVLSWCLPGCSGSLHGWGSCAEQCCSTPQPLPPGHKGGVHYNTIMSSQIHYKFMLSKSLIRKVSKINEFGHRVHKVWISDFRAVLQIDIVL